MGISPLDYEFAISKKKLAKFNNKNIKAYKPVPNKADYTRGYIVRYFIQRVNDPNGLIYEIAKQDYLSYVIDAFYLTTNLDWKIIGTNDEISLANEKSVKLGAKKLPAIQMFLVNYLEFAKQ
jgi:hypothetical protein